MTRWIIQAGSAIGSTHLRERTGCEDAFAIGEYNGALIAAIADGCSGARLSALGATIAVSLAVEVTSSILARFTFMPEIDAKEHWQQFLTDVKNEILSRFFSVGKVIVNTFNAPSMDALATTLSVIVVNQPWVVACSFGDGFIVTQYEGGHLDLLVPPERLGDGDGVTFITTSGAATRVQQTIAWLPDLTAIAMSTDGLQNSALEFDGSDPIRPFKNFFGPLFKWVTNRPSHRSGAELLGFLASDELRKTTPDDMTLVLAVCHP